MGRSVLTLLLGYLVIFNIISSNINKTGVTAQSNLYEWYEKAVAKNIAESGSNMILGKLSHFGDWRGSKTNLTIGNGLITSASAISDTSLAEFGIRIHSYSNYNGCVDSSVVYTAVIGFAPLGVRAGITANAPVTILGNLHVDGRDHDKNGNLIPNSGTLCISTTSTISHSGSAEVSGTDSTGADDSFLDKNDDISHISETGADWEGGFPTTPDEVMGGIDADYPNGTLKAIAQSGYNGSQYVTNPSSLSFPLSGVTYVEMGSGMTWQSIDFGNSSGILVVCNSWTNSVIKTLNNGTFTGLIIADDIDKIHCDIIGAVVVLGTTPSGNCIGNGQGNILYCSEVLRGVSKGYPGVECDLDVISWVY